MILRRTLGFVAFLSAGVPALSQPATGILHVTVAVADADQKTTPVPRHALLISDDPATAEPRQIITRLDGTADVTLRAGRYIVESDRPVVFQGKAYRWTQTIEISAGQQTALALTAGNAEVESGGATPEDDAAFLLPVWNESVVGLWTPTTHASGFAIDANGLVVTNQRVVGAATTVEVQVSPSVKVAANVLVADAAKGVAVLWMDPSAARSVRPVALSCGQAPPPSIATGQPIVAVGVTLRQQKDITSTKAEVDASGTTLVATLATGSVGGPVFTARGEFAGLTTTAPPEEGRSHGETRLVGASDVCSVVAAAEAKMKQAAPPSAAPLPVEPAKPFPRDALRALAARRAGSLNPYVVEGSAFEAAFITPLATFGTQYQDELARTRARGGAKRAPDIQVLARPQLEFSNWSDYVWDFPPVLLIRVTPRQVESFWTTLARGAAMSQGMAIPPIKRFKSGFSRLQAFCGDTEVTPIHPFKLERRVSETDAIYEGLYVYDPEALGPHCASVKLVMYSEKEPGTGDTRVVEPANVQQLWKDFAPYR
jgi:hypothetical protein